VVETFDLDAADRWAFAEPQAARLLQSLLFDADDLVRWRAAETLGRVAAVRARLDLEPAREMLRRTFWQMNDESGGLLWLGPQVVGAVLANVPALCRQFGAVLASFLEEEPFRAGTRWALWRLSSVAPDVLRASAAALRPSLADRDPDVRGHAALALRATGADVSELAGDRASFAVFDPRTGELRATTVADVALGRF
jgi:AraC family transcriptional regulator, regulatory protein of adaptative response / methylated-DNA-[protein]-cysteine methyltransferase